jgi:hypothetical protein
MSEKTQQLLQELGILLVHLSSPENDYKFMQELSESEIDELIQFLKERRERK